MHYSCGARLAKCLHMFCIMPGLWWSMYLCTRLVFHSLPVHIEMESSLLWWAWQVPEESLLSWPYLWWELAWLHLLQNVFQLLWMAQYKARRVLCGLSWLATPAAYLDWPVCLGTSLSICWCHYDNCMVIFSTRIVGLTLVVFWLACGLPGEWWILCCPFCWLL